MMMSHDTMHVIIKDHVLNKECYNECIYIYSYS